jgi:hypothetical protein
VTWYTINKKRKKNSLKSDPNILVKTGTDKITNLQIVTDMQNSLFIEHVEAFVTKSTNYVFGPTSQIKIKHNFITTFFFLVMLKIN